MDITYHEPTYAVFGDAGGHYQALAQGLRELGVTLGTDGQGYSIPKNLTIIQAGDLIHKGPDSEQIVSLVGMLMLKNNSDENRGTWIQLMGNHESHYIPGARPFWPTPMQDQRSIKRIRDWWKDGSARLHFVIPQNEGKNFVVSHAGISHKLFNRGVREQKQNHTNELDAFSAYIESLQPSNMRAASKAGAMLYGKLSDDAGLFWAESVSEVYATWRDQKAPFHQIHGHVTPYSWMQEGFYPSVPLAFRRELVLDPDNRRSIWINNETMFIGIDPGFDVECDREAIIPLMLTQNGLMPGR